jgi:hypothetical protein
VSVCRCVNVNVLDTCMGAYIQLGVCVCVCVCIVGVDLSSQEISY